MLSNKTLVNYIIYIMILESSTSTLSSLEGISITLHTEGAIFSCVVLFSRELYYIYHKGFLVSLTHSCTVLPIFVLQVLENR